MISRRIKSTTVGVKRKKVASDVSPSTSIPPLVEGHVQCFLKVTLSRLLWTISKPPPHTLIRLRWWGETTSGSVFCPRDGLLDKDVKSTARFLVRCGPKQFTSYLTDMGSLVLDVLTKPDHLPIGRIQIPGIAKLSLSHCINGTFTLVSPVSGTLGELQATLVLEPLAETYDSSSPVPTIDTCVNTAVTASGHKADQNMLLSPSSFQFESDPGSSSKTIPIGKDCLYFQKRETSHSVKPKSKVDTVVNRNLHEKHEESDAHITPSVDLLSVLLERGNKLRNAMVVSALQSNANANMGLKDMPLHIPIDNAGSLSLLSTTPSTVQMIQDNPQSHIQPLTQDTAVTQLLGGGNGSVLDLLDEEATPISLLMDSELSDSQYDQSLTENLFYNKTMINGSLDTRDDDHEQQQSLGKDDRTDLPLMPDRRLKKSFHGLTVNKLSLFKCISVARITVIQLAVPTDSTFYIPRKQSGKGKPPLPLTPRKCSYFVEYYFPLLSANNLAIKTVPVEVTRAVSNKVVGGVVKFQHRSIFSVCFSGTNIKRWWDTQLNFTVYLRKSHQKKNLPIGTAQFSLCTLLQSDRLSITTSLPVQKLDEDSLNQDVGPLKVSFELAANKKDFTSKSRVKNMAADRDTQPCNADVLDDEDAVDFPQVTDSDYIRDTLPVADHSPTSILTPEARAVFPENVQNPSQKPTQLIKGKDRDMLFYTLFMVPNGKDFHCAPLQPNIYLNCKHFGVEETIQSVVSWGQTNPTFSFVQVGPINLTSKLLERMKNNVMIIEVWLRGSSAHNDKLLGLVKLPLNQFYMSFRDPKICQLLVQAQFPVVAVDSYMPVVDIFSGGTRGSLRVFLAMGTSKQITALPRMREEEPSSLSQLCRPVHSLDHQHTKVIPSSYVLSEDEHLFLVVVERIKGLIPLQSTIWGEADCYVQYSFPTQEGDINRDIVEIQVHQKLFCTATTLCMPDPVFGHHETHVLMSPPGVQVQRLLLSSLASQGFGNGGGIQFEVWCRYYYPNVREQLVARGLLPMAKLCALVTMQRQGQINAQHFCLPLVPMSDRSTKVPEQPSGLLEVSVQYKTRPIKKNRLKEGILPSCRVHLIVQVHRATGLKAAARAIGLQYCQEVGVNSFVTLQLSFLPENESKRTNIAARSFCPEYKYHTEFCCQLLMQRNTGESVSLAEVLQEATAIFTVYNRNECRVINASSVEDSILGSVKIPLADLLHKRTGISGWYGLSLPPNVLFHYSLTSVGGLELSINFISHCTDRERVLNSAQTLGWEIVRDYEDDWDVEDKKDTSLQHMTFSIIMPRAWLPVPCLLLPGHTELQRSTYCYYRYKLYDQVAFCSDLRHPTLENAKEGVSLATVAFIGIQVVDLSLVQPLIWYLNEEKLEVQLWVSFGKEKRMRPYKLDRLVGSAFVDLSAFSKTSEPKQTISGVYPLFKPSTADLYGAAISVHITLMTGSVSHTPLAPPLMEEEMQLSISEKEEENRGALSVPSPAPVSQPREGCVSDKQQSKSVIRSAVITSDNTFTATVSVERAMHLRLKGCTLDERTNSASSCWVSYVTADEPATVTTAAVQQSECPVWDHQQECRLLKELLLNQQRFLVFKIWNRGEVEHMIGFASVDLSLLLSGFQSVCGWYNITDLSGQCQGQLKVSVSPLKAVRELRALRQTVYKTNEEASPLFATPLCYQTTAVYSAFPSHISRFSEQRISTFEKGQLLTRLNQSDHHYEHMDNFHQFHKNLQEKENAILSICDGDAHSSSSAPLSTLRKNLSELDDIQMYLSCKLSAPVFSLIEEKGQSRKLHKDYKMDTQQLLLKSTQLVGEGNEIMENISENQIRRSSLNTCSKSSTLKEPVASDEELYQDCHSTKDDSKEEDDIKEEAEEEEVEDDDNNEFEETLIEPRPLNEVTSATDRTSPWTTVLSDSELETTEQPVDFIHEGETVMSSVVTTYKTLKNDYDSELLSVNQSYDNAEEDAERHTKNLHNVCVELINDMFFSKDSKQDASQITDHDQQDIMTNLDVSNLPSSPGSEPGTKEKCENENIKRKERLCDAVEIPNFFLQAQQMEASMRAIQLAPIFPSADPHRDPGNCKFTDERATQPRPSIPSSSAKSKETKRIAKIFVSDFT